MTKNEFLSLLKYKLNKLPYDEVEERINFYGEMIDDRIEEGLSEEQAVSEMGNVNEITEQIICDIPLSKILLEKLKSKFNISQNLFLIICSPIWASLLIVVGAVLFSLYASLWCAVISLWAIFGASVATVPFSLIMGIINIVSGNAIQGIALFGTLAVVSGLSIFLFFGVKFLSNLTVLFTKKIIIYLKNLLTRKEVA